MKKITFLICLFLTSFVYSQDKVPGYYINLAGQRTDGYFKVSYYEDETTLRFSPTADGKYERLETDNVNEYGIARDYRFIKQTVQIDRSNIDGDLSRNKEPNFETVKVFLSVVVDGDAALYSYSSGGATKYFYKVDSQNIQTKQLVYKKYWATSTATAENNQFRQQLYADLVCGNNDIQKYTSIRYSKKELIPLFKDFNDCKKSPSTVYENNNGKKAKMYVSIYAGLYNSVYYLEGLSPAAADDSKLTFGGGIEGSYVFPSQKLGIFARLEYEKLSATQTSKSVSQWGGTTYTSTFGTESTNLNFYIGPRYFFTLTEKSKLYIDASLLASFAKGDITQNVIVEYESGDTVSATALEIPITNAIAFNIGVGYMFNNKFAAELRFDTNRDYLGDTNLDIQTKHTRMGLNLKYTIN